MATRPTTVQQRSTVGVYGHVGAPPARRLRGGAGGGWPAQGAPLAVFGPKVGTKGAETGLTAWVAVGISAPARPKGMSQECAQPKQR